MCNGCETKHKKNRPRCVEHKKNRPRCVTRCVNCERLVRFRRDLHRIPELDRDLPETTKYIKKVLEPLPCEIVPAGDAGFCAFFKADGKDGTIAFRTDMDALPITEAGEADYASVHEGCMHACGHDGHMSILLGFAEDVSRRLDKLPKNVLLIFQAAEETTGGASDICDTGVLSRFNVEKVYGLHLWPDQPKGVIVSRRGEFMASASVITVKITGKSTHIGKYKQGIDAMEAAAEFLKRVYDMEAAAFPPDIFRLLRFGVLRSGDANNVVPGWAVLEGALRAFSIEVFDRLWEKTLEAADEIESGTGAKFELTRTKPYPPLINPDRLYDRAKEVLTEAGFTFKGLDEPLMMSEDFSSYQAVRPGLFMHLGTGTGTPLHWGGYIMDESVLPMGVDIFMTLLESEEC